MGDVLSYFGDAAFGTASTDNSSTTPLAGGATFTGTGEQNDYPDALVQVFTDAAGTLYFDFSIDGTNWDSTYPVNGYKVKANVPEVHVARKGPRYMRVRYVNDSGAQSVFRMKTYFGVFNQLQAALNQTYGLDADAIIARTTFPWLDLSRGLVTGMSDTKKFGRNAAVGTSYVPICFGGVYQTPQASAATALRVKAGGNAADTAAGAGARQITLVGLDENFALATETLATAGASASSATTTTFTRVYRAFVSQSGTYATAAAGSHVGNIVIENSAGGTDWLTIDSANFPTGQSEIGAYSVPAGSTAYVFLDDVTIDSGKTVDLVFFARENADDTAAPYSAMRAQTVLTGLQSSGLPVLSGRQVPLGPFTGPCDIGFLGKTSVGTASVAVEFEIIEVQE